MVSKKVDEKHSQNTSTEILRALLLASYFFLLVAGYYLLKPLSRSLFVTKLGSDNLPYVWIATTLVLTVIVPFFSWKIKSFSPAKVTYLCILSLILLLAGARVLLPYEHYSLAFAFYVLIDVYSVIIIENFWSLTNANYEATTGKRYYGLIASGGLVGGLAGSSLTSFLISHFKVSPYDLVIYSIGFFVLTLTLCWVLFKTRLVENKMAKDEGDVIRGKDLLVKLYANPYLRCIVIILFLAQVIDPLVDYQFMKFVEISIPELANRTDYVSQVFLVLSLFGLVVNLLILPLLHRLTGALGGLTLQPIFIALSSLFLVFNPGLLAASVVKVMDRGLSYSSGRASKELLYIPFDTNEIFKIKAWIDIYGYRLFKILASLVLILITYLKLKSPEVMVSFLVVALTLAWSKTLLSLKKYRAN